MRLLSLALMFVVVFAPSVASAAEEFVIRDIIVEGGVTLTVDTVSYYLGLEPGDPLDQDSIADGYHRLWDSGLFESVKIEAEDHGGGEVTLFIVVDSSNRVEAVHLLAFHEPVQYRAPGKWFTQFEDQELDRELAVRREIAGIAGATMTSNAITAAVRRALATLEIGFGDVDVEARGQIDGQSDRALTGK